MEQFPNLRIFPRTSEINSKGHLVVGGYDVVDLVSEYGTPLYVFDEDTLRETCREYVKAFQDIYPKTQVIYAAKAFVNLTLIKLLYEEGLGMDVVSGGEMAAALAGGMAPEKIYFHGNNKTPQELLEAVAAKIGCVVVDSFHELDILDRVAANAGRIQDILIRVSPGVDAHTHSKITTGILDTKFGFAIGTGHAESAVVKAVSSPNLNLRGIHCHIGSQIFELGPYQEAIQIVLAFAAQMREHGVELTEFSPGGGFAIAYTRDQNPPSVHEYAEAITASLLQGIRELGLNEPTLMVEPGRSIVGPAGVALYTVGARKEIPDVRTYISVDGGMGDNIRPALYEAEYEAVVANHMDSAAEDHVTIAGKFCESGDILIEDIDLAPTEPGDIIAIPAAGAYCIPMASNYNMAPRPAVIMVKDGKGRIIRRRETYADLMAVDLI